MVSVVKRPIQRYLYLRGIRKVQKVPVFQLKTENIGAYNYELHLKKLFFNILKVSSTNNVNVY